LANEGEGGEEERVGGPRRPARNVAAVARKRGLHVEHVRVLVPLERHAGVDERHTAEDEHEGEYERRGEDGDGEGIDAEEDGDVADRHQELGLRKRLNWEVIGERGDRWDLDSDAGEDDANAGGKHEEDGLELHLDEERGEGRDNEHQRDPVEEKILKERRQEDAAARDDDGEEATSEELREIRAKEGTRSHLLIIFDML